MNKTPKQIANKLNKKNKIMEKSDMLLRIIDEYTNGNKTRFAEKLGIKPQTINSWLVRETFDSEIIYANCENISGDWLLSGGRDGGMIKLVEENTCKDTKEETEAISINEIISVLTKELTAANEEKIRLLGIIEALTKK